MKTGDQLELRIDNVAFGGDGVGRLHERVVFVPFTAEGDKAVVRVVETRKRFLRGRLERIIRPSPHRIEPMCRHYADCGGCSYQHIGYARQLQIKTQQVADAFMRIGKMPTPPVAPAIASPAPFHYRGKADFHVDCSQGAPPVFGFIDVMNRQIVDIDHCDIVDESINAACVAYRRDLTTGQVAAPPDRLTIWSADVAGEKAEVITDFRTPRFITRTVKGQSLRVPYRGFFQANELLLPRLVDTVLEMSALTGREAVADIYCGSGLFSFFLAPEADRIYGIEMDGEAVHCARWNHHQAGLTNAVFHRGDAGEMLRALLAGERKKAGLKKIDVVILDPPRTGCDAPLMDALTLLKPAKIIYISCNPATQARDVRLLINQGFILKRLQPFDMFPQTAHIETVACLER